jgi:aspartyl-tRNA(Asn)/glutamyl-tRNA(Gln) amidotransferase subunit A
MPEIPIQFYSAIQLGKLLRTRRISSVELTQIFLDRLEAQGQALNAAAEIARAKALEEAAFADAELAAGAVRSPMHGVPYAPKDAFATAGIPTRWGSQAHRHQKFPYDATVVSRLRDAGAVLLGKLAMVELAGAGGYCWASASATGPTLNPWNRAHWSGGSSSGSAAAVAAGAVVFSLATETCGSITVPSAFCGVTGLRPTVGRVSRHGVMELSLTMDKVGIIGRTAEDCGNVLQLICGHDPRDDFSGTQAFRFFGHAVSGPLRLGLLKHDYTEAPETASCLEAALRVLRARRFNVSETTFPEGIDYAGTAQTILSAEGSTAFEQFIGSNDLKLLSDGQQQAGLKKGLKIRACEYIRALNMRSQASRAIAGMWTSFDALIAPTLLHGAPRIEENLDAAFARMGGNGAASNLVGLPSVSVPMGFTAQGLPVGLEILGPPNAEQTILGIAMAFQRDTDHHLRFPLM